MPKKESIDLSLVEKTIRELSKKKLEEYLELHEQGKMTPQFETITLETMAKETYGRFYKKTPTILAKTATEFSYQIPPYAYDISTLRLRGRKLVAPKKTLDWWVGHLKAFENGISILYTDPPMGEFVFAEKIIYTKVSGTEATREIIYFAEIPEIFLYPGIRADVGKALGISDETALHAAVNCFLDAINSRNQICKLIAARAGKIKKHHTHR